MKSLVYFGKTVRRIVVHPYGTSVMSTSSPRLLFTYEESGSLGVRTRSSVIMVAPQSSCFWSIPSPSFLSTENLFFIFSKSQLFNFLAFAFISIGNSLSQNGFSVTLLCMIFITSSYCHLAYSSFFVFPETCSSLPLSAIDLVIEF